MRRNSFISIFLLLAVLVLPISAEAACTPNSVVAPSGPPSDFADFVCYVTNFVGILLPFLTTISVLVFFWGIVKFISAAGDEKKIEDGKKFLVWGVIGLFIMFSIWGILQFFSDSFFGPSAIGFPLLPTPSSP